MKYGIDLHTSHQQNHRGSYEMIPFFLTRKDSEAKQIDGVSPEKKILKRFEYRFFRSRVFALRRFR